MQAKYRKKINMPELLKKMRGCHGDDNLLFNSLPAISGNPTTHRKSGRICFLLLECFGIVFFNSIFHELVRNIDQHRPAQVP